MKAKVNNLIARYERRLKDLRDNPDPDIGVADIDPVEAEITLTKQFIKDLKNLAK